MKKITLSCLLALPLCLFAQNQRDTAIALQPVDLKVHFAKQSLLSTTASLHTLNEANLQQQQPTTLLTAMNTVAGIRMEERSPGSYRLAMRGSLIRSPFGIRNTKIYMDEFPLTDAGGNTYLNLINPSAIQSIMILKGPDGSLYGANSGGIIKIQPQGFANINNKIDVNLTAGSYGLFEQQLGVQQLINKNYQFAINQSYTRSDGYRDNTALDKKTIQTSHLWNYSTASQLRFYAFYTDLAYQTPGGLTQQQYDANPKQARPAAGKIPSAEEQKAAIYNKTLFVGIAHSTQLNETLSHHVSIYGSNTNFTNPFITNYEKRHETNMGVRTYLSWDKLVNSRNFQMQLGAEGIYGKNNIKNYDNDKGSPTKMQANDDLNNQNWNFFYRAQVEILKNWYTEGSLGLNTNKIDFKKYYPTTEDGQIKFNLEWMPRLATSYHLHNMAWRLSFAKGYSTPTIAEVRASDNTINTSLQAEKGNNYEVGYKIQSNNKRFIFDIAAYSYAMKNGILRQINEAGIETYSNVGQMNQKAIESSLWASINTHSTTVKHIAYQGSLTYNHYRFGQHQSGNTNAKGNKITAVPDWVWSNSLFFTLPFNLDLNIYHNFTSSIPLNNENTVFAKKYNLVQTKLQWDTPIKGKLALQVYFGIDNLFNEKYSLGNDINAFGGRYFNPAPTRNFYTGIKATLY